MAVVVTMVAVIIAVPAVPIYLPIIKQELEGKVL